MESPKTSLHLLAALAIGALLGIALAYALFLALPASTYTLVPAVGILALLALVSVHVVARHWGLTPHT